MPGKRIVPSSLGVGPQARRFLSGFRAVSDAVRSGSERCGRGWHRVHSPARAETAPMQPGPARESSHATILHWQALRAGAAHFDQGRYWSAHEAWEEVWRAYHGADRHYLKGLIQ